MAQLTPFLMFQDAQAKPWVEATVAAITAAGIEARIISEELADGSGPEPEGAVNAGFVEIAGQRLRYFDSYVKHAFDFTPSLSLFLDVDSPAQVDALAEALGQGGGVLMPPGEYPFSSRFAWINDRFGVSWQLHLAPGE